LFDIRSTTTAVCFPDELGLAALSLLFCSFAAEKRTFGDKLYSYIGQALSCHSTDGNVKVMI